MMLPSRWVVRRRAPRGSCRARRARQRMPRSADGTPSRPLGRAARGTPRRCPATAGSAGRIARRRTSCGIRRRSTVCDAAAAAISSVYCASAAGATRSTPSRRSRRARERAHRVGGLLLDHEHRGVVAERGVRPVEHEHVREAADHGRAEGGHARRPVLGERHAALAADELGVGLPRRGEAGGEHERVHLDDGARRRR